MYRKRRPKEEMMCSPVLDECRKEMGLDLAVQLIDVRGSALKPALFGVRVLGC